VHQIAEADGYEPIANHGIIGDLRTVALVAGDGSIDFLSFPNFDSPTVFASLLDRRKGGRFSIAPHLDVCTRKQLYLPETNVLLTRFLSEAGVVEISDFMPIGVASLADAPSAIVRRVKVIRGRVDFDVVFDPRFDYGRARHAVEAVDNTLVFSSEGPDKTVLRLRSDQPLEVRDGAAIGTFSLGAGQSAAFVMEEVRSGQASPSAASDYVSSAFKETVNYWYDWIGRCHYEGRWREIVHRSALVLKLLVSQRHGSLVAAATFGLPEVVGGERNWDYRYTWIRDASFTLYALIRLGYTEEAGGFMSWIEDRCMELNGTAALQVMYHDDGRLLAGEETLPDLDGYCGSRPVRIGNGAHDQLQLDIYGELMDAVYLYNKYGEPISNQLWDNLRRLIEWVISNWESADEGIWEVRGGRKEFLYSRLMCWVAVDRGIRLAERRSLPYPLTEWRAARDAIHADIMTSFWNPQRQAFVQYKGSTAVDAATLLMPMMKFISPRDPRWLSTLAAISEDLVDDSLVYRYRSGEAAEDGLHGREGAFTMCSFWYAEAVARSGDVDRARFLFEKMIGYANHLGLYAEELGPSAEHLGNFPQAFTHLALISAAYAIDRKLSDSSWFG